MASAMAVPTGVRSLTDTLDFRLGMRGGFKPYVQGR